MRTPLSLTVAATLVVLAAWLGSACSSSGTSGGKGGGRKKTVLISEYDDERVGREAAQSVESQIGTLDDPELTAYVNGIGKKLLRGVPRRAFQYEFSIVDQPEPNAFALPGGHIFVSRGLLVLANDEDELACVIGHEITHAAHRHAAAQQAQQQIGGIFAAGWSGAIRTAAYGRDMERDADKGGQILCAAAGYNPMGMSTFLRSLDQFERIKRGASRRAGFFDTHPGAGERSAVNAVRAKELRWTRDKSLGDTRASLLTHTDGLAVDQRPEAGLFVGDYFMHPDLDFMVRFPAGWDQQNTNSAVGAVSPKGDGIVYLTADQPPGDPKAVAEEWVAKASENQRLAVKESQPVQIGELPAWRLRIDSAGGGGATTAYVTFVPYRGATWRITGAAPTFAADRILPRALNTARSFRPLTQKDRDSIEWERLRIATARPNESFEALNERTNNAWPVSEAAVYNGLFATHVFEGGEFVKVAHRERYQSPTAQ